MEADNRFSAAVKVLESLSQDELFQNDLKDSVVQQTLRHWTERDASKRLHPEEARNRFNDNYKVKNVFRRIKQLEVVCKEVPMKISLKAVLAAKTDPFCGIESLPNASDASNREEPGFPVFKPVNEMEQLSTAELFMKYTDLNLPNIFLWWSVQILLLSIVFANVTSSNKA